MPPLTTYALTYTLDCMTPLIVRLRAARKKAGLSQAELARRSGVPQPTISRIEAGHHRGIDLDILERLAIVLKTKPGDLIVRTKR